MLIYHFTLLLSIDNVFIPFQSSHKQFNIISLRFYYIYFKLLLKIIKANYNLLWFMLWNKCAKLFTQKIYILEWFSDFLIISWLYSSSYKEDKIYATLWFLTCLCGWTTYFNYVCSPLFSALDELCAILRAPSLSLLHSLTSIALNIWTNKKHGDP